MVNAALTSSLQALASTDALDLHILDTYSLLHDAFFNHDAYGFSDVINPCWTGDIYGNNGSLCATSSAEQDTHLFWDGIHPTERAHGFVAIAAANALSGASVAAAASVNFETDPPSSAVPEPATWSLLGGALIGLVILRRSANRLGLM